MKLTCDKNEFQELIILAERNSSKNPSLPILSAILLKAEKNKLTIISTNLEVGFEAYLPVKITKDGEAAVSGRVLLSLLSSMPEEPILLEKLENTLKISSKNSSTTIKCLPHEEFPILPKISDGDYFSIKSTILAKSLASTVIAAAITNTKPELASILISAQQKTPVIFAATDSFRLAEQRTNIQTKPFNLLLPQKTAVEVMRIFQDLEEDVAMRFNKNQISFSSKYLCLISRLIDGKFPDYQGIIPKQFSTQAVLDKNSILGSLKAASVFSSKLSDVGIKAEPKDNIIEIKASSSETGEHKSQISAKISGDAIQATFNFRYLIDAVSHLRDDKIFLGFNGPDKAILVRPEKDTAHLHLIMPMRGV